MSNSKTIEFRSMWSNPYGVTLQDLSNPIEDVFEEVAPYAIDAKSGELLNSSSVPKIVKVGSINVKEKIVSFAKEVNLYNILEKFAYSDDASLLNARQCSYGDLSNLPDNLNDYAKYVNAHIDNLSKINPELGKMVIDPNVKAEDIEAKANEILKSRIEASKVQDKIDGGAE